MQNSPMPLPPAEALHAKTGVFDAMMKVQNSILRSIVYGAIKHGANFSELCKRLGIDPLVLNDAEGATDWEVTAPVWDIALEMTGDPLLGLHMGQEANSSAFGMLGYLMQSCPTLEAALASLVKYNNTLSSIFTFSLERSGDTSHLYCEPVPVYRQKYAESARQATDMGLSGINKMAEVLTGKKIYPLKIELAFPARNQPEYEKLFGSKVLFNGSRCCMVYRRQDLLTPIISYDTSLYSFLNLLLAEKQQSLSANSSISQQIKEVLLREFHGQVPPVEVVAARLQLSLRTLQRRLAQEKITFRQITNEFKKELALSLVRNRDASMGDVADLLGYADLSSFRRAYRNWKSDAE